MAAEKKKKTKKQDAKEAFSEHGADFAGQEAENDTLEHAEDLEPAGGNVQADFAENKALWQKEKEELLAGLMRKQADLDNLRRINKREQDEMRQYGLQEFLKKLLPVLDDLERGLKAAEEDKVASSYIKGLEMIYEKLLKIFEQEEVNVICALGEAFDPNCHHAVMQVEDQEAEPGTVVEELQKGYRHKERILRPAMVKVCK